MFRNILVSVDGSPHAQRALTEAIDLASCSRARLTIITAVPRPPGWVSTPATAVASGQLALDFERESTQILRDAVDRVPDDVPVTKILSHAPIRDALMKRIKTGEHDLLVIGSRGRGTVIASILGSVSRHALNHSPIPVLVVHCDKHAAPEAALPARTAELLSSDPALGGRPAASVPPPA